MISFASQLSRKLVYMLKGQIFLCSFCLFCWSESMEVAIISSEMDCFCIFVCFSMNFLNLIFAAYQKHNTPSLEDPVWRLRKISRLGATHKKLECHGIKTVRDFLMQYHIDPDFLRNVRIQFCTQMEFGLVLF